MVVVCGGGVCVVCGGGVCVGGGGRRCVWWCVVVVCVGGGGGYVRVKDSQAVLGLVSEKMTTLISPVWVAMSKERVELGYFGLCGCSLT